MTKEQEEFLQDVMVSLIDQVRAAMRHRDGFDGNEREVVTLITRRFWVLWCAAVGLPPNSEPGPWEGLKSRRVYGSLTIVVESDVFAACSFVRHRT